MKLLCGISSLNVLSEYPWHGSWNTRYSTVLPGLSVTPSQSPAVPGPVLVSDLSFPFGCSLVRYALIPRPCCSSVSISHILYMLGCAPLLSLYVKSIVYNSFPMWFTLSMGFPIQLFRCDSLCRYLCISLSLSLFVCSYWAYIYSCSLYLFWNLSEVHLIFSRY